jgi:DNA repair exonuclease SbcCD ATPase subunit
MGKKADKWKAKYDELMRITEAYIRHLHDAHARIRSPEDSTVSETCWVCDDSCDYDHPTPGDIDARVEELEVRIEELESEVLEKDRELAEKIEAREEQESEAERAISSLEDERHRLECRVDELSVAIDDLLEAALNARVTRLTVSDASGQLDPGQRVHLFEGDWDRLIEACRDARCTLEGLEGRA